MTWVKLCGMRTAADVAAAQAAGADAIGFVTAAGSVRRVLPEEVASFESGPSLERFLVTRDETPDRLLAAARTARVTGVQPHGDHAVDATRAALEAGFRVLFPIAIGPGLATFEFPAGAVPIFDGLVPGSGMLPDHDLLREAPGTFVLAGGLTTANVAAVCSRFGPYGVDVSSGIETIRGVKDPELMAQFVQAAR